MTTLKLLVLALMALYAGKVQAGLEAHRDLLVADRAAASAPGRVRVTYLGTNGYLLESRDATVLVDPYVSRIGLLRAALNARIAPDPIQIRRILDRLPEQIDAVLVTHGHIDHLLDAVPIARVTGARLIASRSSVLLAKSAGAANCQQAQPGDVIQIKSCAIHVLPAGHDRLFGHVPFPSSRETEGGAPERVADWVCGEPLAFQIELAGRRIYIDSGGTASIPPPPGPVDLAILGVALADGRARFSQAVLRLRPRYILPSHQDDFFRPLSLGFRFGLLTNFPQIRRAARQLPGRLILLDYFRPWTLP